MEFRFKNWNEIEIEILEREVTIQKSFVLLRVYEKKML